LARRIQEEIARRHLPQGALFATEAQLCEIHGVSRTIVREAVSRLRALGILRSVQKKGLVVGGGNPLGAFARAMPFFARSSETNLSQLSELRYVLEIGAVELAVWNRTPEQLRQLLELAEGFAQADQRGDMAEQNRVDLEFHCQILEMTGNPMIAGMAKVLSEFFHSAFPVRSLLREERTVAQHRAIAQGIAQQNIELVRVLIRQHLAVNLTLFNDRRVAAAAPGNGRSSGAARRRPSIPTTEPAGGAATGVVAEDLNPVSRGVAARAATV
jgi:GntR family transcriptional repressor for pyruvate dehydrogenase complex